MPDLARLAAAVVLVTTLAGVAAGRVPRLRMNRATIALVGAVALVTMGAVPLERARAAVDLDTLGLLLGMMVLNANLRMAGLSGWSPPGSPPPHVRILRGTRPRPAPARRRARRDPTPLGHDDPRPVR